MVSKKRQAKLRGAGRVAGKIASAGLGLIPGGGLIKGGLKAIQAAQRMMPGRTSKAQAIAYLQRQKKKKSAKVLLKRAYEKRARRQVLIGQLGQARKTLARKRSVI